MGIDGISFGSLALTFSVAYLLLGGKRMRNIGQELASAIRQFRQTLETDQSCQPQVITEKIKEAPNTNKPS